jgi:hypothetical protein
VRQVVAAILDGRCEERPVPDARGRCAGSSWEDDVLVIELWEEEDDEPRRYAWYS